MIQGLEQQIAELNTTNMNLNAMLSVAMSNLSNLRSVLVDTDPLVCDLHCNIDFLTK